MTFLSTDLKLLLIANCNYVLQYTNWFFYRKRSSQLSNLVQSNGTNAAGNNKDEEKIVIGNGVQDGVNMAVDAGAGITYGKYLQVIKLLYHSCLFTHNLQKFGRGK